MSLSIAQLLERVATVEAEKDHHENTMWEEKWKNPPPPINQKPYPRPLFRPTSTASISMRGSSSSILAILWDAM